ncbi:hypothetical protein PFICI_13569 [Pestalotiopsis fici W106-1]|uniref:Uncharacterized protein n=1 Tax=Pestalotiopsis fici (strain W106-1 / CGMCC3.15140) TaxID=1229662 RepID=W3WMD9_PESFW|nr:uncharacterized protein PFICI_13569 [Pestalotiopsis fici W106-1]ETS75085.1 hypothetical protein PFICI_13569 [Pestalotiopsis fici W106-1]
MASTADELRQQFSWPSDILSLLLLIGGDIVQTAIAQQTGFTIRVPGSKIFVPVAPVCFSFGWVAYGFSSLLAAVGEMRLMPKNEISSVLVNCSNGFAREVQSWALGRLLRDHEIRCRHEFSPDDGAPHTSIRIDIFEVGPVSRPDLDFVWWLGWATLLVQLGIAIIPLALYNDWGVLLVALGGNVLVALTCASPQWNEEKWAGRRLEKEKVTCLTRGNGHSHVMVFISSKGSWDLESLATGIAASQRVGIRWITVILAMLWSLLLISVSGLKERTWFMIGIGAIGMLQNIYAAGTTRQPETSDFHLTPFARAQIIVGRRGPFVDETDANVDLEEDCQNLSDLSAWVSNNAAQEKQNTATSHPMPKWLASMSKVDGLPSWLEPIKPISIERAQTLSKWKKPSVASTRAPEMIYAIGVHGALIELEKWVPTAGLSLVNIFFPGGLEYSEQNTRNNIHKKFWKRAYHTLDLRKKAEEKRRSPEL